MTGMLSRTAENLYWTARYMERCDTAARLLEVGYRMSMMPTPDGGYANEWSSILAASGSSAGFNERYKEPLQRNVISHMVFDQANPSSMKSGINAARHNGRAVRTALTTEVWEALNQTYHQFQDLERRPRSELGLPEICDWMKSRAALVRGAFLNTQLEDEGHRFFNLGYAVERMDNTARLLDVKYYILLPTLDMVGGGLDNYQWSTLLRALSAFRSYHWEYDGDYRPRQIGHFLILNPCCPRSLLFNAQQAEFQLAQLSKLHGETSRAAGTAADMVAELSAMDIEQVFDEGLHEFLTRFISRNADLSADVAESYLFGKI